MTDTTVTIVTAICAALPPTLLAVAAIIKISKVHSELNSRLSEWKKETADAAANAVAAALAQGNLAGVEQQKLKEATAKVNIAVGKAEAEAKAGLRHEGLGEPVHVVVENTKPVPVKVREQ